MQQPQSKITTALRLLDVCGYKTRYMSKEFAAFGITATKSGGRGRRVDTWIANMGNAQYDELVATLRAQIIERNKALATAEEEARQE